jgi:hypothetical protein
MALSLDQGVETDKNNANASANAINNPRMVTSNFFILNSISKLQV